MQSQSIIVIHPGSQNLRIGKASDLNPHIFHHAVARRRKPWGVIHEDLFLPEFQQLVSIYLFEALFFSIALSREVESALNVIFNNKSTQAGLDPS